jgi:Kef-type K+ transport system membrane component KefB
MSSFGLLIAEISVILIVARLIGLLFQRFHQPRVIGEMAAGILLGPSFLGWLAPGLFQSLFPLQSQAQLSSISQIGLLLFMFLIGLELDLKQIREMGRITAITSLASILVPFLIGVLLAQHLYPIFSDPSVNFTGFVLFMGSAMSITAFPVLARILIDRDLLRTRVGILALTCAAVNDVAAWFILAGIIVLLRSSDMTHPLWAIGLGLGVYLLVMFFGVRRLLQILIAKYERLGSLTHDVLALILLFVLASGWSTELLGVHALFGAFLAGVVMPRHENLIKEIWQRMESLVVVLLLPLYFASTGLRSNFLLIDGATPWLYCALIIALAIAGKLGGTFAAARIGGFPAREATAVGLLMNTRGLVELVILNIGFELGVLSPTLFSIMVLMALATTLMTSPLIEWVYPDRLRREIPAEGQEG